MARTPQPFDRWQPASGATLAHTLFRRDMVEINHFTWHAQGVSNHAQKVLSGAQPDHEVRTLLDYGLDPGNRSDTLIQDGLPLYKNMDNWTRLMTVVMTASAFELFIRRIVTLSAQSDPGLLIGRARTVDGTASLRNDSFPDLAQVVKSCTEGQWTGREAGLTKLYGQRIPVLFANIGDLQKLQNIRNSIAHEFGRTAKTKDFWYIDPERARPEPAVRVSASRLQSLLRTVAETAKAVEAHALQHIGCFELFLFWHKFLQEKEKPANDTIRHYIKLYNEGGSEKLISTYHHLITGRTLGRIYCAKLIACYDAQRP